MRNLLLSLSLLLTMLSESRTGYATSLGAVRTTSSEKSYIKAIEPPMAKLEVHLHTATAKTIRFEAPEHEEIVKSDPMQEIPQLVLTRNGVPTPGFERTLFITLDNLSVPQAGLYVELTIETQHKDPDLDRKISSRIPVWEETRFIPYDLRVQQAGKVQFSVTFDPMLKLPDPTIKTPTDYYRYQIAVSDSEGNPLQSSTQDYAFLMENQWRVPLPNVLETTPGAAPDELIVYYYDMVPFQTRFGNPDTQIPRQAVARYIQTELIPEFVKAFETQTNLWDLPWHKEWSNYRSDEDPKTLSIALGGNRTWFHGSAPSVGHAMISIRVDGVFGEYSTLTDGIMSVFHHELFHNQQRNISLHFTGNGTVSGKEDAWQPFSEGIAVLASSVGQPAVQFETVAHSRSYFKRANAFIGSEGAIGGGLNKSYKEIPYHTALYWRFLYENCGGVTPTGEDPSTGMNVIRHVLETLYQGEIVQINSSTDVAGAFPHIMDQALQSTPSCKFQNYEESLVYFARAIYLLRLEDGRCLNETNPLRCGFIDPHSLYQTPPADMHLVVSENTMEINGSIPSSYGIDLNELTIDPSLHGKNLKLVLTGPVGSTAEFHVEVWKTRTSNESSAPKHQSAQIAEPISLSTEDGRLVVEIDSLESSAFDGLGLIIIRTDPYEEKEATGAYSIQLLIE
jgi:hypothetical protein